MFSITVTLEGLEAFVERIVGPNSLGIEERDRILAETNPSMGHLWYGGETYGKLWLKVDETVLEIGMLGPTVVLDQMLRARDAVASGEDSFEMNHHGGYGVEMRVDVDDRQLRVSRTPSGKQDPSNHLDTTVREFVSAVSQYEAWYHTEYLAQASWLLQVEDVQQYRVDAGYPPDRL